MVAIKSETDVGADCLTVDQVRDIYRAGSPLTNWSQPPLGFDDVPLKVGGPNPDNNGFGFFGRYVLDAPGAVARSTCARTTTSPRPTRHARRLRRRQTAAGALRAAGSTTRAGAAPRPAQVRAGRPQRAARREAGARDRPRGARQGHPRRAHRGRPGQGPGPGRRGARASGASARADVHEARAESPTAERRPVDARSATPAASTRAYRGHVAYFRFSYYELFEDQLRPVRDHPARRPAQLRLPEPAHHHQRRVPAAPGSC